METFAPATAVATDVDRYEPRAFEASWEERWEQMGLFRTGESPDKPKFYCLDMFPYPSGAGLSVGHCHNYIPTDVISRFMRMRGYNVLHPMGWDAFGQPAENEAIKTGTHPRESTTRYTKNYKRQLRLIGASYDWEREINSSTPDYYQWTQWFFLLLFERGLAYRANAPVWWCPKDLTTLANEEAPGGLCWRCGTPVVRREMEQWFFRITAYADRLLDDLKTIDWPENLKIMQENWIGRSEGAEIVFHAEDGTPLPVFTTRPDTLFGATSFVMAPEHPLVERFTTEERRAQVRAYVEQTRRATEIDRQATGGTKTGVPIGSYAINPINQERIPIWIADYALLTYGTGMVMGVPAHDQRDFDFARQHDLPCNVVITPPGWQGETLTEAYLGDGVMVNSGEFNGLPADEGKQAIVAKLATDSNGRAMVSYKMRDWLISRQRYWGAPIPIVHCPVHGEVAVPKEDLPVILPYVVDWEPTGTGRSPLENVPEFVHTTCPTCGEPAKRETDTMGGFACSSWYFLRFASPHAADVPFERAAADYWLPVDLYVGGLEHAVMHLLYARFWTKVMYDAGIIGFQEPFQKYRNQGVVHAADGKRMSKSRGNVVTPDSVVERYGADALRLFELFMGPFDQDSNWSDTGINGTYGFLRHVWDLALYADAPNEGSSDVTAELRRALHKTIQKVTTDVERLHFNTAVSALMEFRNSVLDARTKRVDPVFWRVLKETLLIVLAPMAPYISEELWHRLGHTDSVHLQAWPSYDPALVTDEVIEIVVQVNGKVRDRLALPVGANQADVEARARTSAQVRQFIDGKRVVKTVYVPGRLLNFAVA
jgi:leucyl-tRNA synthetase